MERIEGLLRELGNPKQKIKTVHVTGTNGKGSVTSMITNILLAANLKVVKFTSPHLVKYNELAEGDGTRLYVLATVGIIVGGLTDHVYFNTQMGLCFWTLGGLTMLCKKLNEEDD